MEVVKKLNLSSNWKMEKGWRLDLGLNSFGIMKEEGEIEKYNDRLYPIIHLVEYDIGGWVFSNVDVIIITNKQINLEEINTLDDILNILDLNWNLDDFIVSPTDKTRVLEKGDPEAIFFTNFHKFLIEGD